MSQRDFDLIVIGAGAAGMMAAITAAKGQKRVLLLEKLPSLGAKLKATGGGRCNLTNTLDKERFMERFGKEGRFMRDALDHFDTHDLRNFFHALGVETDTLDGFRVFPKGHNSQTILEALQKELLRHKVVLKTQTKAAQLLHQEDRIQGVLTQEGERLFAPNVIIATGGLGYPTLGAEGDGYALAKEVGHTTTPLYPAMLPLRTKERWVEACRADTIAHVRMRIDLPKAKKLRAFGDLIFTKEGIRGPVVLDFAREITPLLQKHGSVPILVNLTQGKNEEELRAHLKAAHQNAPNQTILTHLQTLLPHSLSQQFCQLCQIDPFLPYHKIEGKKRDALLKLLAWTPLTVVGTVGFSKAMITRGGIPRKEINPKTMQSKRLKGLYFCGEVVDLDGPCGGYNLQWSFSSGYLAGLLKG